ncbi:MAG TPA: metallophosphoesterase [Synergistaceae bacterium]|nr:metallophosphoesterase [Synergistaceae bacterium]
MGRNTWLPLYRRLVLGLSLPVDAEALRGKVALHFSDTPSTFYGVMRRLIRFFEPQCIVHTGDLADDVKLEIRPGELPLYRRKLMELTSVLSSVQKSRIVLVTGNHDHEESVREFFPDSSVIIKSWRIEMCGLDFNLSHEPEGLQTPYGHFNLFGHAPVPEEAPSQGQVFLNGLYAIHVLRVDTGEVLALEYPGYVNDARLNKRRVGL